MNQKIALVADDDNLSREFLAEALRAAGWIVDEATTGRQAITRFDASRHALVLSDIRMPDGDGLEVLEAVRKRSALVPLILVTAYGSVDTAVKAMRDGATDFLMKPVAIEQIEMVLSRLERRSSELRSPRPNTPDATSAMEDVIGESAVWKRACDMAQRVAGTRATVLIRGESGTGKEGIATLIHRLSDRRGAPFIKTNCAVLHDSLLSSELFGHEKGAFTSAHARKEGRFELADGGTLFLDEIGEISPEIQAKLLRVLETGEFERVGGKETLKVDVRVVCATNRDLESMMDEGRLRADLYYRLNVIPVFLPPLRDRGEDIILLARHFLATYAREYSGRAKTFSMAAERSILAHPWPGNVRELKNVIQRTALLCTDEVVDEHHLGLRRIAEEAKVPATLIGRTIDDVERELILGTLSFTKGSKVRAAEMLGVTSRTLSNKIKLWKELGTLPAAAFVGGGD